MIPIKDKTEPTITYTYEPKTNNTLSFFDFVLMNNNNELEFKVYHKSINCNGQIHQS